MRGRLIFILAILSFLALVPLVYWNLFEHGLSASQAVGPAPNAPLGLRVELVKEKRPKPDPIALSVTEISGSVEVKSVNDAAWKPAELGIVLEAKDRIRTFFGSQATLSMPGVFSVRLRPESEFKVRRLAENIFRFLLKEGMISADVVQDSDRIFEVSSNLNALARTNGASFNMNVTKKGAVSVGTTKGQVSLSSMGKVVQIKQGYQAEVRTGQQPADPIKIPTKLFLKVRWPTKRELSRRRLVVRGKTLPNTRVSVSGVVVEVDPKGRFRTVVALKEGRNRLKVEAENLAGKRKEKFSPTIRVDTKADGFQIKTSPNMWNKKRQLKKKD